MLGDITSNIQCELASPHFVLNISINRCNVERAMDWQLSRLASKLKLSSRLWSLNLRQQSGLRTCRTILCGWDWKNATSRVISAGQLPPLAATTASWARMREQMSTGDACVRLEVASGRLLAMLPSILCRVCSSNEGGQKCNIACDG